MNIYDPRDYGAIADDNIDDTFAIQAALDAAAAAGGGHVVLSEGTFILTGTGKASDGALNIFSNTELSGAGMGNTVLKLQDGWSSKISGLIRTPVNQVTADVIIRDITLDGNRSNVTADVDGLMTGVLPGKNEYDDRILIERVEIHDVSRIAFNPHEQTQNLIIRDSIAHHNSWDGFIADFVSNAIYENNVAYSNDRHGFNVVTHSHDVVLRGNTSYDNGENGIVVQRGSGSQTIEGWENMLNHDVLLEGNTVYGNGSNGILMKQVENSQIIGNIIYDNAHDAIQLEGANNIIVDGNHILSSTIFGIEIRPYTGSLGGPGSSYDNTIINNVVDAVQKAFVESGSTTMNDLFAGNLIGSLGVALVSTSTITEDSVSFVYDTISVTVTLPQNYTIPSDPTPETNPPNDPPVPDVPPPVSEPPPGSESNPPPPVEEGILLMGDSSDNTLTGTDYADTIKGRTGKDTIYGGGGDDIIEGNEGDDILFGGLGKDTLKGGYGWDVFGFKSLSEAGQGDVIEDFNTRVEKIDLSGLLGEIAGFTGDNAFTDGFLSLVQNGQHTELYVDYDGTAGPGLAELLVTLQNVSAETLSDDNFIPTDLNVNGQDPVSSPPPAPETDTGLFLSGDSGNNTLTGSDYADTIKGRTGKDTIYGGGGDDDIQGNEGDDILFGGLGKDTLKGGWGWDIFGFKSYDEAGQGDVIEDFNTRVEKIDLTDMLKSFVGFVKDQAFSGGFLKLVQNGADAELYVDQDGSAGPGGPAKLLVTLENTLVTALDEDNFIMPDKGLPKVVENIATSPVDLGGSAADDTMHGSNGADRLVGHDGHDTLYGYAGDDRLWGNNGNDTLHGGKGSDWMKGGEGADLFVLTVNGTDRDTISDLRVGDGDVIMIENVLGYDPLSDAIGDFIAFSTSGTDTVISVDTDGAANGHHFTAVATVSGVTGLDAEQLYASGNLLVSTHSETV